MIDADLDSGSVGDAVTSIIDQPDATADQWLPRILEAVRKYLDLDVGFISRFNQGRREFLYVAQGATVDAPDAGDSDPLDESTCFRVASSRAPSLVEDATSDPSLSDLEVIGTLGIKTHISVPIALRPGNIYGTLCCYSTQSTKELDERDVGFMTAIADIIGSKLEDEAREAAYVEDRRRYFRETLKSGCLNMVWQPVVDAGSRRVVAVESLARFHTEPWRPPNEWFDEAVELGIGNELERIAFGKGCEILEHLPEGVLATCNVSGETLLDPQFQAFLDTQDLRRVVIEITEHDVISDYDAVARVIERFRKKGAQLAVDDFGAGYASFRHILELSPDVIKLDMSMVRDIDQHERAQRIVAGLMQFAREDETSVVAEGVETEAELAVLKSLGIRRIQGYLIHKPLSRSDLIELIDQG